MALFLKSFPNDLRLFLRMAALKRGVSLTTLIASILEEWREKEEGK